MFKIGFLLVFGGVPVEGVEFKCAGTKLAFLTMTSKAAARLCARGGAPLKRAGGSEVVGQVYCC